MHISSIHICWYKGQGHLQRSRSNIKVIFLNVTFRGHECFTNKSWLLFFFVIASVIFLNRIVNSVKGQEFGPDLIESIMDDRINVAQMTISVFDRKENIVGKEKKNWLLVFSSFRVVKLVLDLERMKE